MKKDVFVSYSSKDAKTAAQICQLLEERRIPCWIAPRDVVPGKHYAEEIMDAIESTTAFVLVLSDHSNDSRHVRNEIEVAVSKGKSVFPVRIRNVEPAKAIRLLIAGSQWVDAWTPPIEQKIEQLAGAIRALTGVSLESGDRPARRGEPIPASSSRARLLNRGRLAAIAAVVVIGLVATLWLTMHDTHPVSVTIPSAPQSDKATSVLPSGESPAGLDKLKGALSDYLERREFENVASTVSAIFEIDRDNREALEAQTLLDRLAGRGDRLQFDVPGNVVNAVFSPDGRRVTAGCSGSPGHPEAIIAWDLETGRTSSDMPLAKAGFRANCVAFSSDGTRALTGGYSGLDLYNLQTGERLSHSDAGLVTCALFLGGATRALVGGNDVAVWDLGLNTVVRRYSGHTGRVQAMAITPDGKRAVTAAGDATIRLWDLSSSSAIWSAGGPRVNLQSLAITPDEKYILSGGDGVVRVLALDSGREVTTLQAHKGYTLSLAVSPDGTRALSGGTDNIVRLWDLTTARQIRAYLVEHEWTASLAFSPDGRRALFGTIDGGGLHVVSLPD